MAKNKVRFFIFFILIFIFLSVFLTSYKFNKIQEEKHAKAILNQNIQYELAEMEQNLLKNEFKRLVSDIIILKEILESELNASDFEDAEDGYEDFRRILLSIVKNKRIYDQIRYIDETGQEIVRVDLINGKPFLYLDSDSLQNKSDRYYFIDTMKLKPGEVYTSKLDLNVEHGKIEHPKKPMLRVGVKVYDDEGKERGILVSNYYAKIMINNFLNISKNKAGSSYILNSDSYFISNVDDPKTEFAFMYDEKKDLSFKTLYPDAYKAIFIDDKYFYETETDVFYAKKIMDLSNSEEFPFIVPLENIILGDDNFWIVSHIKKANMPEIYTVSNYALILEIFRDEMAEYIVIFVMSLALAYLLNKYLNRLQEKKNLFEHDKMTGVYNRRFGIKKTEQLILKSQKHGCDLVIVFIDVNGLKSVNDVLGHHYGDELITTAANIIGDNIRENDILFRYGGDEFVLCLEKADLKGASMLWERVLNSLEEVNSNADLKYNISLSHGLSIISKNDLNRNLEDYIKEADRNMYVEKTRVKQTAVILK